MNIYEWKFLASIVSYSQLAYIAKAEALFLVAAFEQTLLNLVRADRIIKCKDSVLHHSLARKVIALGKLERVLLI